jgi:hypothetical protein
MQPDNTLVFGELNPDGSIKRDVRICAISFKPIEGGDGMIVIPGTSRFYRVKAPFMWPQSAAQFAEYQQEIEARLNQSVAAPIVTAPVRKSDTKEG